MHCFLIPGPYQIGSVVGALVLEGRCVGVGVAVEADIALLPTVAAKRVKCLTSAKFAQSKAKRTEDDKDQKIKCSELGSSFF